MRNLVGRGLQVVWRLSEVLKKREKTSLSGIKEIWNGSFNGKSCITGSSQRSSREDSVKLVSVHDA